MNLMNTGQLSIEGGDYDSGGAASRRLKEALKKIGVRPEIIRRAVIAAYEAEMNVVIYARKGNMSCVLNTDRMDITVEDEGPGIPDIDLAMREGYSTAPPEAREQGFGAGMGLPNIKKNSDRFSIRSRPGRGVRIKFTLNLQPSDQLAASSHSIETNPELCIRCMRCVVECPVGAIRVRGATPGAAPASPEILEHICVDCASCIRACGKGALKLKSDDSTVENPEGATLVAPSSLLAQFGPHIQPEDVLSALREFGFGEVKILDSWSDALRDAVTGYAADNPDIRPIISPVCQAVVNLVTMRFPSLIDHVAPFMEPLEAALSELDGEKAIFMTTCPARSTLASSANAKSISPEKLLNKIDAILHKRPKTENRNSETTPRERENKALMITGMLHVINALEEAENGLLNDMEALELYACDGGCHGSPLLREESEIAKRRGAARGAPSLTKGRAIERSERLVPRAGIRLDEDMSRAIEKLARIDKLIRSLPGRNCSMCGAPDCEALAEDVALGRALLEDCPHLAGSTEESS